LRQPRGGRLSGPPAVLGIDLGTSQVKALLRTSDGTALGQGTAAYQVAAPRPGWAEINPEHWWQATCQAVRAAVGPASAQVAGLAVAGQMHGLILCSERAVVLRPAITWLDRRAEAEADEFERLPETLRARLGNAPSPGLAGPILLWLSRHEPDAYWQARWMLQPKDWLRFRLTAQAATDPTDASGTLLADVARGEWATEVVRALGLRPDLLPAIHPPAAIAGPLLPAAAEHLGLPPGLPVAVGAADTAASLLAADLPPQWGLLTLGTGGQLVVPVPTASNSDIPFPDNPSRTTNLFRAVDGGTYRLGGLQNVGVALDWVRRTLGASWDELYRTADRPWQAGTPVFLPYLVSERGGHRGSGGAWTGLTLAHQRDDLLRAALEGVAFLLRGKLDDLRALCAPSPVALQLAGGGSRTPAWRQLLADALAVPLHPVETGWLTARGAAQLAAAATGFVPDTLFPDTKATARSDQNTEVITGASRLAEPSYHRFASAASSHQDGLYPCIVLSRERGERPAQACD
jgi:xylulokinase